MNTLACLYTFGRVYLILSMENIHETPILADMVLLFVVGRSQNFIKLYCIDYLRILNICSKYVINLSLHLASLVISIYVFNILCSPFNACLVLFLFQLYSIIHAQYLSSTRVYIVIHLLVM